MPLPLPRRKAPSTLRTLQSSSLPTSRPKPPAVAQTVYEYVQNGAQVPVWYVELTIPVGITCSSLRPANDTLQESGRREMPTSQLALQWCRRKSKGATWRDGRETRVRLPGRRDDNIIAQLEQRPWRRSHQSTSQGNTARGIPTPIGLAHPPGTCVAFAWGLVPTAARQDCNMK